MTFNPGPAELNVIIIKMHVMARSQVKYDMGVVEGCPKPAHAEDLSPSSMIPCNVFQSDGLCRKREGLDKRPASKHAIVALSIWSRNGWYEQLVITRDAPASLSPVKCATRTDSLASVTMGEKHRLSE